MDVWLLQHGAWIGWAGAVALVAAGVAAVLALRAVRLAWAARLFGARAIGARRGLTGAGVGERVLAIGVIEADRPLPLRDPRAAAVASAEGADRIAHARAPTLVLRRGLARTLVLGDVAVDATLRGARVIAQGHARARLRETGRWPGEAPIAIRSVGAGDRVAVIGRAMSLSGEARGYRVAARTLAIGPDHDGTVHVIGLATRATAISTLATGLALGTALVVALYLAIPIGLYLPPPVRVIEAQDHLPYHLWLPLASPMREEALARASAWVTPRLWWNVEPHTLDLAEALMEVSPDCRRDAALVSLRPELDARLAPTCDPTCAFWIRADGRSPPDVRARAEAWLAARGATDTAATLCFAYGDPAAASGDLGLLGPTAIAGSSVHGWRLIRVTHDVERLTPEVRALRVAWLHDLALLEGARGRDDVAHELLDLAREARPEEEEAHAMIEAALARRTPLERDARDAPHAAALLDRISRDRVSRDHVSRDHVSQGHARDRPTQVLAAYASTRVHASLTREAELVASMRAAGAAAALGHTDAAGELASLITSVPLDEAARAPRAQVRAYVRSQLRRRADQGTAQVPW